MLGCSSSTGQGKRRGRRRRYRATVLATIESDCLGCATERTLVVGAAADAVQCNASAARGERMVDRLDDPHDLEAQVGGGERLRSVTDGAAEVLHLQPERLGGVDVQRDDVARSIRE